MRRRLDWKAILSTALFALMVILLAAYLYHNREELLSLLTLDARAVVWLLVASLCGCLFNCLYHRALLRGLGMSLSLCDWVGVVFVSNAIAYVLPMRADLIFTGAYYKRVKGMRYTRLASLAAGNIVFGVIFSLAQILVALVCMALIDGQTPAAIWLCWALGTACVTAFLFVSLGAESRVLSLLSRWRVLKQVVTGFNELLKNRAMLWRLLVCLAGNNLFHLLCYMQCFRSVGLPITIYEALFYNSVSWLAGIVAIVPGNIGIKESVMGAATLMMGALFRSGVAASLLQRAAVMVIYIAGGLIFALPVTLRMRRGMAADEGDA